jgi:hypothetical protein
MGVRLLRGKPWSVEEERRLRQFVEQGLNAFEIGVEMGKNANAVYEKAKRLGLRVIISRKSEKIITSSDLGSGSGSGFGGGFVLSGSGGLPSVEEALKVLVVAVDQLRVSGLGQAEILRLRSVISGVKVYKELLADFLNYRELEQRLIELEGKYAGLVKKAENV